MKGYESMVSVHLKCRASIPTIEFQNVSLTQKEIHTPVLVEHFLHVPPQPPATLTRLPAPWTRLCRTLHISGITHSVAFCVWLLSLSIVCSRSIHSASLLFWPSNTPLFKWTAFYLSCHPFEPFPPWGCYEQRRCEPSRTSFCVRECLQLLWLQSPWSCGVIR